MNLGLKGKVAAVTGARKGIGRAIALALASEGVDLAISSRDKEGLQKTADQIAKQTGVRVVPIAGDLSKKQDQESFIKQAAQAFQRIDILVNNAGSAHIGDLLSASDEAWEHHLNLKLLGYIRLTRAVIPWMQKQGGGVVLNIVGGYGKEPDGYAVVPGVINAGLLNLTRAVASRHASEKIRVLSINPAVTQTDLMEEMAKQVAATMGITQEKVKELMVRSSPMGRVGKPEDVASLVVFLASDAASFMTGISVSVDGGIARGI